MRKIQRAVFLLLLISTAVYASKITFVVPQGKSIEIDFKKKKTIEMDCPENCGICFVDKKDVICTSCNYGYFLDQKQNNCEACAQDCQSCKGPGMENCSLLSNGVSYDVSRQRKIMCPDGCIACDQDGKCSGCNQGYYSKPAENEKGEKQSKFGHFYVTCEKCKAKNCSYCNVLDNGFSEICTSCEQKYGLNPVNQQCEPCMAHCLSCTTNSNLCNYCEQGYFLNSTSRICEEIKDSNCKGFNARDNVCSWCGDGYFLDKSNQCVSCDQIDKFCSKCYLPISTVEIPNPPLTCTQCLAGMYFDITNKKCLMCTEHCVYCQQSGFCQRCRDGFYVNDGKCVKMDMPNCISQRTNDTCSVCQEGYYLDQNKCSLCHSTCYSCAGSNPGDCRNCPVTKISHNDQRSSWSGLDAPMMNRGGMQMCIYIAPKLSCLSECPSETPLFDPITRDCKADNHPKQETPKSKYYFNRSPTTGRTIEDQYEDLLSDASEFEVSITRYSEEVKLNMKRWAKEHPSDVGALSPTCNYLGTLQEKLSRYREVIYECKCKKGFHGAYCNVDREEIESIEHFVVELLTALNNLKLSVSQSKFYSVFKKLLSAPLRTQTLNICSKMLAQAHPKKMTDAPWEYLTAMDKLLHAHFDYFREAERALSDDNRDIDKAALLDGIFDRLHEIIDEGQLIMARSLKGTSDFPLSQTTAFQNTFKTLQPGETNFLIYPSDLRGTNKESNQVNVKMIFKELSSDASKYGVLGWAFSSLLFGKNYGTKGTIISYVVALQVVNKDSGLFDRSLLSENDELWIQFPLRVTPDISKIHENVRCLEIQVKHSQQEQVVKTYPIIKSGYYNTTDNLYVYCKYPMDVFYETFLTVGYGSDQIVEMHHLNSNTGETDRFAMNSEGGWEIASYPGENSGGFAELTALSCILVLVSTLVFMC